MTEHALSNQSKRPKSIVLHHNPDHSISLQDNPKRVQLQLYMCGAQKLTHTYVSLFPYLNLATQVFTVWQTQTTQTSPEIEMAWLAIIAYVIFICRCVVDGEETGVSFVI